MSKQLYPGDLIIENTTDTLENFWAERIWRTPDRRLVDAWYCAKMYTLQIDHYSSVEWGNFIRGYVTSYDLIDMGWLGLGQKRWTGIVVSRLVAETTLGQRLSDLLWTQVLWTSNTISWVLDDQHLLRA